MKRKFIAVTLAVMLSSNFLACGGGKKEEAKGDKPKAEESKDDKEEKPQGKTIDIASMREKYASSEAQDYTEAKYNLERNHTFKFDIAEEVAKEHEEDLSAIYSVSLKADGSNKVDAAISIDKESGKLKIKAPRIPVYYNSDDSLESKTEIVVDEFDTEVEREHELDWGNANNYYLTKHIDTQTGEKLERPEVTVFTIKPELDTPTVQASITTEGLVQLEWEPVEGADNYIVCKVLENKDKVEEKFGKTYSVQELAKTKETTFENFSGKLFDFNGGVLNTNTDFEMVRYAEDSTLGEEYLPSYCVMAVSGDKKSIVSNMISADKIAGQAPIEADLERNQEEIFNKFELYDKEKEMLPQIKERLEAFPTHVYVKMGDGASVKAAIDFDTDYFEYQELEKSGLVGMFRYKIRGTSIIKTYPVPTEEESEEFTKEILDILKELQKRQEEIVEQGLNQDVDIDIETTPPAEMEATEESEEDTTEEKEEDESTDEDEVDKEKEEESEDKDDEVDKEESDDEKEEEKEKIETDVVEVDEEIFATSALSEYVATAMLNNKEEVNLDAFPEATNKDILIDAVYEAIYQNPMVMTVDAIGYDYVDNNLIVEYGQTADEQEEKQQEVAKEVTKVVDEIIKDDMTDLEKEFAINDYLVDTAEYDNAALEHAMENDMTITDDKFNDSFTPYGVLINKVGVCASYASAFKLLADEAELESIVVTGNLNGNLPHAWNRVKIGDEWIAIDTTNNDIEQYPNALLNLPDEVSETVLVEDDRYILDERIGDFIAKSDESEFYKVEENFFDEDKVVDEIVKQIEGDGKAIVRTSYDLTESEAVEIINKAIEKGKFNVKDAYTWLGVISIEKE